MKYKHPKVAHLSTLLALTALTQSLMATPLRALQTYPLVDHQKTEIEISQTELNRIAVSGDRIQQVFGAEGLFDVQTDDEGGQIFLKLNRGESKPITVTLITEEGLTQDLRLIPQAIDSQSILFKPSVKGSAYDTMPDESVDKPENEFPYEILTLMKAMVRNEESDGFKKAACERSSFVPLKSETLESLELSCLSTTLGDQIEGRRYSLVNRGTTPIPLKEEDFAGPEDLAITLMKSTLHPQETTTLYIISRRPQ